MFAGWQAGLPSEGWLAEGLLLAVAHFYSEFAQAMCEIKPSVVDFALAAQFHGFLDAIERA